MSKNAHRTTYGLFVLLTVAMLFVVPAFAHAQTVHIVPSCALNQGKEPPGLDCILQTFANIAALILSVTGSFALLMFVYGGFMMLVSGGSEERVSKGKTIVRNAVIGIFIILLSGALINYGLNALGIKASFINAPATPTQAKPGTHTTPTSGSSSTSST